MKQPMMADIASACWYEADLHLQPLQAMSATGTSYGVNPTAETEVQQIYTRG